MPLEPSQESRQRMAFGMLREQARSAHLHGDGLQVANLSETALQEIERLIEAEKLLLPLRDIQWAFIFQLFWLLSSHNAHISERTLNKLPARTDDDRIVLNHLQCYAYLICQPLDSDDAIFERLENIFLDGLGDRAEVEMIEMVRHLIELAWFRHPSSDRWITILNRFSSGGPPWIKESLKGYHSRLTAQIRLTTPDIQHPVFSLKDSVKLREISPLAELWLLHLQGNRTQLIDRVAILSSSVNAQSYTWRQISDYWHTNSIFIRKKPKGSDAEHSNTKLEPASWPTDDGIRYEEKRPVEIEFTDDTTPVWLSRRRSMSADYPILSFHDYRESKLEERLLEIFRDRSKNNASVRFEIWQLSMLHELAGLRLWDFWMWRNATHAQGQALLEACQWEMDPLAASGALMLLVRSLSCSKPGDDWLTSIAVKSLEFASDETRSKLISSITQTYPRQKFGASDLLEAIADMTPPEMLDELATWTIDFAKYCRSGESFSWKNNYLKYWPDFMPLLSPYSKVWEILTDEVYGMATNPHCCRMADTQNVMRAWLVWAPWDHARKLASFLVAIDMSDLGDCLARAEMVNEVESYRPELTKFLSLPLLERSKSSTEREILREKSETKNLPEHDIQTKTRISSSIRDALTLASPPLENRSLSFGPFPAGIWHVKNWTIDDLPLINEIIATINAPTTHIQWMGWLINTLQIIVSNAESAVSEVIKSKIGEWVDNVPMGRNINTQNGPYAIIQMGSPDEGDIHADLGWLIFQLVQKLGASGQEIFLRWTRAVMFSSHFEPLGIAAYGCLVISTNPGPENARNAFSYFESALMILTREAIDKEDAAIALGKALRYSASILASPDSELVSWKGQEAALVRVRLLDLLVEASPLLMKSSFSCVRRSFGLMLWNMKTWESLPIYLVKCHEALLSDARASVRLDAAGSWKAERERQNLRF